MTGPELKQLVGLSDYTIVALATQWGISREYLGRDLFKSKDVGPRFERLAAEAGLLVYREKVKAPVASVLALEIDRLRACNLQLKDQLKKYRSDNKWLRERLSEYRKKHGAIGYSSTQLKAMGKEPGEEKEKKTG